MPQRQAITILIIYCSKPQQSDAVTPTPLAHRSHTCMRALALGHDKPAPPPHAAAMGNASPVRGLGGADDSAMAEGLEPAGQSAGLDEGVAPGSGLGGAVVAPADGLARPSHEVGRFLHGPAVAIQDLATALTHSRERQDSARSYLSRGYLTYTT